MQRFLPVQLTALFNVLFKRDAVDQFHDDVLNGISHIIAVAHIIDRNDVRMRKHGDGSGFRQKTLSGFIISNQIIFQDLDGIIAIQFAVQ